jgi:4-diphosphocytidyl-2-C-methyl-D-erythritol kinase
MLAAFPDDWSPFRITLEKNLPIAAGIGGGSSDAAATLRLMAGALGFTEDGGGADDRLTEIARRLGSDVPACLGSDPVLATGRGDACDSPPAFPDLDAVLVNPLVASATGAVYRAYDEAGAPGSAEPPPWPDPMETPQALVGFLAATRNDLEAPAVSLAPAIGEVLTALRGRGETLFARMSGSGATCFAICAGPDDARDLALALVDARRDWWVRTCRLKGWRA